MLRNYLKIAFRNLYRQKLYSLINILGLAVGIAFCILIILFVKDEWSYDKFHLQANRIYRVALKETDDEGREYLNVSTPIVFEPMFRQNLPEVEEVTRVFTYGNLLKRGDVVFTETIHLVDDNFFEVFDFPLLKGSRQHALSQLNNIVITEEAAEKYFGSEDPIGKALTLKFDTIAKDFVVSAVAQNTPTNSSIRFDFLIPFMNGRQLIWSDRAMNAYFQIYPETYIRMPEKYPIAQLEAKVPAVIKQSLGEDYKEGAYEIFFQPLTDIHLNKDYPEGIEPISDPAYSYILGTVAILVLLIAGINFITMSLGRSATRAKEVGVRKVVGASRSQLVQQFWGEAMVVSLIAFVVGLLLAELAMPMFNKLSGKSLDYTWLSLTSIVFIMLALLTGVLAGIYPAVYLSRFKPVEVLKGKLKISDAIFFRHALVVFQFSLSIGLIICTLIMGNQLRYMQQKNLGFAKEFVVNIPTGVNRDDAIVIIDRFKNELAGNNVVAGITYGIYSIGEGWLAAQYRTTTNAIKDFYFNQVDENYLPVMQIELVEGRNFSKEITSDEQEAILVNEALVRDYGLENPVGKRLPGDKFPPHQIIGVVKDFNYESLHTPVKPLILGMSNGIVRGAFSVNVSASSKRKMQIRLKSDNVQQSVALLEQTWKKVAPNLPYSYSFLDETLARQYEQETRLSTIMNWATGMAIFIACLGLFSLATLAVQRRRKEIGVRKVMGASVNSIVLLFSKEFVQLILIALLVASPLAYMAMHKWLQDFAYQTNISVWVFAAAGTAAVAIALLTVSYQVVKAALSNPVHSLRDE